MSKFRTTLVAVAVACALLTPTATANAGTTSFSYDNGTGSGVKGRPSQDVAFPYDNLDSEAADDFVVPRRTSWKIDRIEVEGFVSSGAITLRRHPSRFTVTIFSAGTNGTPGVELSRMTATVADVTYIDRSPYQLAKYGLVPDLTLNVAAGTHWISVRAHMDYLTQGQWTWLDTDPRTPTHSSAVYRKASGSCTSWCKHDDDMTFKLTGVSSSS